MPRPSHPRRARRRPPRAGAGAGRRGRGGVLAAALALVPAAFAGCGGGDDAAPTATGARGTSPTVPAPGAVDPGAVRVIRAWADTLRAGDVAGAARRFGLPAAVANGSAPLELRTRAQALAFNRSLPCGAVLVDAQAGAHGLVVASLRLTERRGPGGGACGDGIGRTARVAFVVEDGLILH